MTEEYKTTAIVMSVVDYKEKDKLVNLFSLELGMITATLKGVKSSKAKLKFAGQPFCFGEFVLAKNGAKFTITSVTIIDQFYDLTTNYDHFMLASQMMNMIPSVLKDQSIADELFLVTIKTIRDLTYENIDGRICVIKFMLEAFKIAGYSMNFECCTDCGNSFTDDKYLDIDLGNFVCSRCVTMHGKLLPPKVFDTLKDINTHDTEQLLSIDTKHLTECLNVLITNFYYRFGKKLIDLITYLNA